MTLVSRRALSTLHKIIVGVVLIALISGVAYNFRLFNRPPMAAFSYRTPTRTLKYIAPTDQDMIIFTNNSTDPDGDQLTSQWFIRYNGTGDWKLLNSSTHHSGRLPVSNEKGHEIKLLVSDGMKEDSTSVTIPVDTAYLLQYPVRKWGIPIKGINYGIGFQFGGEWGRSPDDVEVRESFTVIKDELNCSAIRFYGDCDDKMIQCAQVASEVGFNTILLSPRYDDFPIEQHMQRVLDLAKRAESVRTTANSSIILVVGNEMSDRVKDLNDYLRKTITETRKYFNGEVTYAELSGSEKVDWKYIGADLVASNIYYGYEYYTDERFSQFVRRRILPDKRTFITETGACTNAGALRWGSNAYKHANEYAYSQEEQAICIEKNIELLKKCGVDGIFLFDFLERKTQDAASFGILKYQRGGSMRRKLAYYLYKSYGAES